MSEIDAVESEILDFERAGRYSLSNVRQEERQAAAATGRHELLIRHGHTTQQRPIRARDFLCFSLHRLPEICVFLLSVFII